MNPVGKLPESMYVMHPLAGMEVLLHHHRGRGAGGVIDVVNKPNHLPGQIGRW